MMISTDSTIAVIGAGAMGSGIAQVAAQAGHNVLLIDASEAALDRSKADISASLDKLVQRGKLTAESRDAIAARLRWSPSLEDAAPAALVIEAIIEDMDAKLGLFDKLGSLVASTAILASNTSSLSIGALADRIDRPQRFAGLHFFNPVPVMKLVEVVPAPATDVSVTDALIALMKGWGKVGVRVRDVPGFIVNRVARPYYAEGFAALGEGLDPAVIDQVLQQAGGFRMGPLTLADMIGHDVNFTVARSVYEAYHGDTRFRPQKSQQALFDAGRLGRKSGSGVYDYSRELPEPSYIEPRPAPSRMDIAPDQGMIAPLVKMAAAAGVTLSSANDLPPECLRANGVVMAMGDGRTLSMRDGIDVIVDHARDLAETPAIALTARSHGAACAAAGLFRAFGKKTISLPDRPGQLVLRTLAQLANAAADAVADGVASAGDIDAAMRFGANHPEGPLAWAARVGYGAVANSLVHIAQATGDAIYAPAEYFRQPEIVD